MSSAPDTKHLYPIAVLIDELKSEDQKKRYDLSGYVIYQFYQS